MKKMCFVVMGILMSMPVLASTKWKVQKLTTIGYLKNPVLFQSRDLKYVKSKNLYKGKVISQWGLHVFEVSSAYYNCDTKKQNVRFCRFHDYEPLATFEKCRVLGHKASCEKQIKANGSQAESDSYYKSDDLVDSVKDDMHRDKTDEWDEYPPRDPDNVDSVVIGF